jgi:hypothetical protein
MEAGAALGETGQSFVTAKPEGVSFKGREDVRLFV